ncbi:LuxR C-terminal-related transcriptional regulator [Salinibacterium sp. G-O1]|uniref:LuxR C-terminal-related transcriptional regulator n=1 Tax=Salinibacterium sp. G-O1 TaxID=3046208 RepID=UPI0024B99D5E|nr:LuxR C-terminal-related transcriptional regulator [Salinibacterium sp. G-O1]MDJ0333968.1 LuxR C-terminal-related transcriptional regulator [Salinibacterium sp. G-O1]
MVMPVLATKLFVPPLRPQAISRSRITRKLDDGMRRGAKLTLISAPAGFGKTTVLSEWIASSRLSSPDLRVAWLSLDSADNDPARFQSYLTAAIDSAISESGFSDDDPTGSLDVTIPWLLNKVAQSPGRLLLVLDDFQLIEDPAVREAVELMIDHLPSTMHVAIASRSDPLLPLARLRARGELTEIRASDLRFTPAEAGAFLTRTSGKSLSDKDIAALGARTEGWIAGLQLAALSLRDRGDVSEFITAFTGSNRFIIDYLIEEVLDRAPLDVREFLCQTAILDRLSGPLADATTGSTGGAEMLEALERANMFVVPLDDERQWYRYHHLFADVLRVRLMAHGTAHVQTLHSRASEWFESNDSPAEAVQHGIAGSDFARAARVIESTIPSVRKSRQDTTLLGWLAQLPPEVIGRRPVLQVFSAWASLVAGDVTAVEPQLAAAERQLEAAAGGKTGVHDSEPGSELDSLPVTIALYRAAIAMASEDMPAIRQHAQRARDLTAPDDHLGRGAAAGMLGLAAWSTGDLETGIVEFRESAANLRRAGNVLDALSTTIVVSDMLVTLGRLKEARAAYERALLETEASGVEVPPAADLHSGLSRVLHVGGQAALATQHLSIAHDLGEEAFAHEHRYRWSIAMADARRTEGDLEGALDHLRDADKEYRRGFFPDVQPIGALIARLWIEQGRAADAHSWATDNGYAVQGELTYLREFGHITLARALIAHNTPSSLADAATLLDRLLDSAEGGGRAGCIIEISLLVATILHAQQKPATALASLERALNLAEPEGYIQLFLDEGAPILALLRTAAGAGIQPDFVRLLSQSIRNRLQVDPTSTLADPLSERELQVLRLLATELTGPQISRELHISLNTMRTHTRHIFLKLEASERAGAVRRAETLGLI